MSADAARPGAGTTTPEPVASRRHLLIVVAVLAAVTLAGAVARGGAPASGGEGEARLALYANVLVLQGALVLLVRRGVRRAGGRLRDLVKGAWRTGREVALDLAAAAAFWGAWEVAARLAPGVLRPGGAGLDPLLPVGAVESAAWVLVSVVAGFSEELVFRGYLQRQLTALARSRAAGVALQAALFGATHAYQGARRVAAIALVGLLYGVLAEVRGNLRPGMLAHAWTDVFGGLVLRG